MRVRFSFISAGTPRIFPAITSLDGTKSRVAALHLCGHSGSRRAGACRFQTMASALVIELCGYASPLYRLVLRGFSPPLLLSTGQNRELQLFTYVAILDLGALALVVFKPWRRLLLLSYAGTLLLYIGWYSADFPRHYFSRRDKIASCSSSPMWPFWISARWRLSFSNHGVGSCY